MKLMHRQRSLCDAIVVGAATARIDNPSLTTRYWPGKSPLRVVLSRKLSLPGNLNSLTDGRRTIIYNSAKNDTCGVVEYVKIDSDDPQSWLEDLYRRRLRKLQFLLLTKNYTSVTFYNFTNYIRIF